ncbi:MAG: GDP-mannose 4,6-dehydratase [Candidatus Aureabacteria bacterium]|nr:GDP-mannose 4,6-dehydratase [Candidatus Auribacterota bacterium]
MKILVTGGAGFIGSHLVERLLEGGRGVVCLDDFNDSYDPAIKRRNISPSIGNPSFTLVEGDIRNKDLLHDLCRNHQFGTIVHLAARAGVRESLKDPLLYEEVNCLGTLNLLDLARRHGIRHFIFGSSSSIYGVNAKVPFSEEDRVDQPISPYAATKRACELLCYTYHHLSGMNITCLRFFTVYGPRQRPEMAICRFTRKILRGEPIELYGDGTSQRDYTYVDDIMDGLLKAIDKPFPFEIFNLGESQTIELTRLIRVIEEAAGKKAVIKKLPAQPGDTPITYADISKARAMLGYRPRVGIEEGIARFVSWYKGCALT